MFVRKHEGSNLLVVTGVAMGARRRADAPTRRRVFALSLEHWLPSGKPINPNNCFGVTKTYRENEVFDGVISLVLTAVTTSAICAYSREH